MTVDIDRLAELARAATPGPWSVGGAFSTDEYVSGWDRMAPAVAVCFGPAINSSTPTDIARRNAAYIAAANPTAILALIARLRAAEADAELLDWIAATDPRLTREALQNAKDKGATYENTGILDNKADAERFRWLLKRHSETEAAGAEDVYAHVVSLAIESRTADIRAAIDDAMRGDGADANT